MRILVTGGAGFIGSTVVDQLVERGDEVVVVDNLHPGAHRDRPDYLNADVEYRWGDIRDADVAKDAVAGVDAVAHQAAMVGLGLDFADVGDYVSHNDIGTATLLGALHDAGFAGRLVLAASMVAYGEGGYRCTSHGPVRPGPRERSRLEAGQYEPICPTCGEELEPVAVDESAPVDPRNVYAATKVAQEHLVAAYGREHPGTLWVALRYHNVYGPRMPQNTPYAGVASIFRSAAAAGRAARVFEDGGQRRDFVHVADVARANVAALTVEEMTSGPYNVASGQPHTVLDLAAELAAAVAGAPTPEVVGGYRAGDVRHVFASPQRAATELGFRAEVDFADGVREFSTAALRS